MFPNTPVFSPRCLRYPSTLDPPPLRTPERSHPKKEPVDTNKPQAPTMPLVGPDTALWVGLAPLLPAPPASTLLPSADLPAAASADSDDIWQTALRVSCLDAEHVLSSSEFLVSAEGAAHRTLADLLQAPPGEQLVQEICACLPGLPTPWQVRPAHILGSPGLAARAAFRTCSVEGSALILNPLQPMSWNALESGQLPSVVLQRLCSM